jgi:hypothetical protein
VRQVAADAKGRGRAHAEPSCLEARGRVETAQARGAPVRMRSAKGHKQLARGMSKGSGKGVQHVFHKVHLEVDFRGPSRLWLERQAVGDAMRRHEAASTKLALRASQRDEWALWLASADGQLALKAAAACDAQAGASIALGDAMQWPALPAPRGAPSAIAARTGPASDAAAPVADAAEAVGELRVGAAPCAEDAEWVCLSPQRLCREALLLQRPGSRAGSVATDASSVARSDASATSSKWMLLTDDDCDSDGLSFTEEEVCLGDSDGALSPVRAVGGELAPPGKAQQAAPFINRWSRPLFFEEHAD